MPIRNALLLAGGMTLFTLAVVFADKAGYIGDQTSQRAVQVVIGLIVVYCANLAPKTLEPLSSSCAPARVQALQRFSGWAIVLGGLGYTLAWIFAPFDYAAVTAMAILGTALVAVVARCLWTVRSRDTGRSAPEI